MRISGWLGSGLLLAAFGGARQAAACSCVADGTRAIWPDDGAQGVPLDTPIVAEAVQLDRLRLALISDAGYVIELVERRRLPSSGVYCSGGMLVVSAASPLEPNTRYNVQTWARDSGSTDEQAGIFFTTGTGMRDVPAPAVDVHVFAASEGSTRLLEAFVETDADEPLLIRAQGERAVNVLQFDRAILGSTPLRVPFGATPCGDLEVMDIAGNALQTQRLCEPTKCATVQGFGGSSCGGESFSSITWQDWQVLPDGCGTGLDAPQAPVNIMAPTSVEPANGAPLDQPAARAIDGSESNVSGGCHINRDTPAGGASAYWLLTLAALASRRSQRVTRPPR